MSSKPKESPMTIADFFKTPRRSTPQTANCPICEEPVPLRDMNDHLDQPGGCSSSSNRREKAKEAEEKDRLFDSDSDSEFAGLDVTTPVKRSYSFEQCTSKYFSSPSPSKGDASNSPKRFSQEMSSSSSTPSKRLRASRELSNNPKRFGGIESLDDVEFSSPRGKKKSARNRSGSDDAPTATDVKKPLFDSVDSSPSSSPAKKHVALTEVRRKDPDHVPYYIVNFEHVVRCVIDETDDRELFSEQELVTVEKFRQLSLDAKKVFVRLFQRKHSWLTAAQINYDEVQDLDKALVTLVENNFMLEGKTIQDLEVLLKLLSAPGLRSMAKEMKVVANGLQKADIVQALVAHSRQKSMFFKQNSNAIEVKLKNKARSLLGNCFKLEDESRKLFMRILSLYSLTNWWDERENDKGQPQQLTTTLLVNQGKLTFPAFDIIRQRKIFRHREDLIKFEEGCTVESKISEAVEDKDWKGALVTCDEARLMFDNVLRDADLTGHVSSLPVFLRRFTLGSVLAYALTKSVEVLERQKEHLKAVDLIRHLLAQDLYLPDYHGHWYERLALDLDTHLRNPAGSLKALRRGLDDPHVREGRRLSLCQRVAKITCAKRNKSLKEELHLFQTRTGWLSVEDTPKVVIQGRMMTKDNIPGAKTVFLHDNGTDKVLCSVEEYVREVYKDRGMVHGLHGEGAVVNTFCFLLFWGVLYDLPVPDAFRCPNQSCPLDLDSDDFYASRRREIDARLDEVEEMSDEALRQCVVDTWKKHFETSSCVSWELFNGPQHLLGLLLCFTRKQLRGICERLVKSHRNTRSGFPDLTVWNPEKRHCQIIEVKGPNDRLSTKQILWIDYLKNLGVDAFVCHVEAIGGKRIVERSPLKEKVSVSNSSSTATVEESRKGKRKKRQRNDSDEDFMSD